MIIQMFILNYQLWQSYKKKAFLNVFSYYRNNFYFIFISIQRIGFHRSIFQTIFCWFSSHFHHNILKYTFVKCFLLFTHSKKLVFCLFACLLGFFLVSWDRYHVAQVDSTYYVAQKNLRFQILLPPLSDAGITSVHQHIHFYTLLEIQPRASFMLGNTLSSKLRALVQKPLLSSNIYLENSKAAKSFLLCI